MPRKFSIFPFLVIPLTHSVLDGDDNTRRMPANQRDPETGKFPPPKRFPRRPRSGSGPAGSNPPIDGSECNGAGYRDGDEVEAPAPGPDGHQ